MPDVVPSICFHDRGCGEATNPPRRSSIEWAATACHPSGTHAWTGPAVTWMKGELEGRTWTGPGCGGPADGCAERHTPCR